MPMETPSSKNEVSHGGDPNLEKILDELSKFDFLASKLKRTTNDLKDFAMSDDPEEKAYAFKKLEELRLFVEEENLTGLNHVLNLIIREGRV